MIAVDAALLAVLIYYRSIWILIIVMVLIAIRRVPHFANVIAELFDIESYTGLTATLARFLLPGWESPDRLMSSAEDEGDEAAPDAVVVPVPNSLVPPGQTPPDRDITRDGWIVAMAEARDENGDYTFSANQIDKAIGAHRATTLARVKEVRANIPPAQFRQEDQTTAPAHYPVTKP